VALGRLGNVAQPSGESRQGGPHWKNELHGDVWSVEGEWRGGGGRRLLGAAVESLAAGGTAWSEGNHGGVRCPWVVVSSSWCGEVVLDGAMLGVWSNRSKRGWSGLFVVAQRPWVWWWSERHRSGEVVEEEEKWCSTVRGGSLYSRRGGGRRRRGGRNRWAGETAAVTPWAQARWWPPVSEGGRHGPDAVGPWFRPGD
jgi:hypothetical protein